MEKTISHPRVSTHIPPCSYNANRLDMVDMKVQRHTILEEEKEAFIFISLNCFAIRKNIMVNRPPHWTKLEYHVHSEYLNAAHNGDLLNL
jgi:hypothetical protein